MAMLDTMFVMIGYDTTYLEDKANSSGQGDMLSLMVKESLAFPRTLKVEDNSGKSGALDTKRWAVPGPRLTPSLLYWVSQPPPSGE